MTEIKRYVDQYPVSYMAESDSGDWVDYDDHAAIVAEKNARIAVLELMLQKNAVTDGNEISALQEQVRALAAETVALKKFCKKAAFDADYEAELGMERGGFTDALNGIKTPATDAALREIRAQGVDGFVEFNRKLAKDYPMAMVAKALEVTELTGEQYAARIRSGEQP